MQGAAGATICTGPFDALPAEDGGVDEAWLWISREGSCWEDGNVKGWYSLKWNQRMLQHLPTPLEMPPPPFPAWSSGPRTPSCLEAPLGCLNSKFLLIQLTAHRCPAQHFQWDYSLFVTQSVWKNPSTLNRIVSKAAASFSRTSLGLV